MSYILDANVFIQAKNFHYGFDFCPAFWDWLLSQATARRVYTIDKVAEEIISTDDDLSDWMKKHYQTLVCRTDAKIAQQFSLIGEWIYQEAYEPAAVNAFMQGADFYLIAHAVSKKHIVVTHEVSSLSKKRIKIPNVCIGLGLRFMTPYEMLRQERARFVLGK